MKKQVEIKKPITLEQKEILNTLVSKVFEKYECSDIVHSVFEHLTGWREKNDLAAEMLKDDSFKSEAKEILESEMKGEFFVVKLQTIEQKEKLTDFVQTAIYPYYNEQQQNLFN